MTLINELNRWIAPLRARVFGMVKRARILSISDDPAIQVAKIDLGNEDVQAKVERVQPFGLSSHPRKNAQAIVLHLKGNPDHPVIVVCDDGNYRVKVAEGEVAVYNAFGAVVKLRADATIDLGTGADLAPTAGIVTGECIDPFTGAPFPDRSLRIKAQKV